MKISSRPSDPEYSPMAKKKVVYLNGELLQHCFKADEEAGEAWAYATDEQGKLRIEQGRPVEVKRTGTVEVKDN